MACCLPVRQVPNKRPLGKLCLVTQCQDYINQILLYGTQAAWCYTCGWTLVPTWYWVLDELRSSPAVLETISVHTSWNWCTSHISNRTESVVGLPGSRNALIYSSSVTRDPDGSMLRVALPVGPPAISWARWSARPLPDKAARRKSGACISSANIKAVFPRVFRISKSARATIRKAWVFTLDPHYGNLIE